MEQNLPKYTQEDFLIGTEPYEEVYQFHKNPFAHEQQISLMAAEAEKVGLRNFKKLYGEYTKSLRAKPTDIYIGNSTNFQGQPLELDAGDWQADDMGIFRRGNEDEMACCHPILPVERLVNIDTGIEKLKLKYSKGRRWREVIADKKMLASANSILALADVGVAVNSENAKWLVRYLHDVENLNYDTIPERRSVSRLGFISDEGFSPYVDGLIFDGDANFRAVFESIRTAGERRKWMETAAEIRRGNVMARIVLAAAFASVLVAPIGGLPFFVHLWGGESGTGKTVALMLAASVWGCPELGRYIQTFNSTVIGRERLAAFLNHLPLLIDELQLAKDARGKLIFDVYALAEGVGKTRSNKTLGVDRTSTWANCIITTGETPITAAGSGAGAVNRVIEIECRTAHKIIEDGHGVSGILKKNYGFAGREFVRELYEVPGNIEKAERYYKCFFRELSDNDTTEKQAMAAAAILTADTLAANWIFRDSQVLTVNDISAFLASRAAVSAGARGYEYMCQWVTQNINKFNAEAEQGEIYGVIGDDGAVLAKKVAYVIKAVFLHAAESAGFSPSALLSYLKENGLILTRGRNLTRCKRIRKVQTECVALLIDDADEEEGLPFGPGGIV